MNRTWRRIATPTKNGSQKLLWFGRDDHRTLARDPLGPVHPQPEVQPRKRQ